MYYIEIDGALVNLENGHTFRMEEYSMDCHRILSNGNPIMEGKKDEIKKAFKIIKERALNNTQSKSDLVKI